MIIALPPARLFRVVGSVRLPPELVPGKHEMDYSVWTIPVEDDGHLIGFARVQPRKGQDFLDVVATIDYESAIRLDIEVGRKTYLHPTWWFSLDRKSQVQKVCLDSLQLLPYPVRPTDDWPVTQVELGVL